MLQYYESAYSSRYVVSTTPPTALSKCFWNFTSILLVVWGYTCALVILKLCFLIFFFFLIFSTFLASIFFLLQYLGKWYRTNGPLVNLLIFNSSNKNKAGDMNSLWNLLIFSVTGEKYSNHQCRSQGSNLGRLCDRQTLYHIAIKACLYRKAVQLFHIPITTTYDPSIF